MTDQQPDEAVFDVRLSATLIPDDQTRILQVPISASLSSSASCVVWPRIDDDDPNTLVVDVITATPFEELAGLLEMVAEGLRQGTVQPIDGEAKS